MKEITNFYIERPAKKIKFKILNKNKNSERPAWIQLKTEKEKAKFFTYLGKNQIKTKYKKLFNNYFVPLDCTSEEIISLYEHLAKEYDSLNPTNFQIAKFVKEKAESFKPKYSNYLDLFGGTGIIAEEVSKISAKTTVQDGSKHMLMVAKKKPGLKKAKFVQKDFLKEKVYGLIKYDLITCSKGLQYYDSESTNKILEKIKKILKRKGIFIIVGMINEFELQKNFKIMENGLFVPKGKDKSELPYFICSRI